MINYFVIGTCLFLLIAVIFIAAKPISMGIEARRNIKDDINNEDISLDADISEENNIKNLNNVKISEEIIKLNQLKKDGLLNDVEYEKAKKKLLD
tara:strand:+ start:86 stop:370 length:285 start_codon:yes stop_codon:yes gene_type:complete